MKNNIKNIDPLIGRTQSKELTKKEHDEIRAYRQELYQNKSEQDKLDDILAGFRFKLHNYAEKEDPKNIIHLGQFFSVLLKQINIKKGKFAEYIEISSRNINKYFNGERKFNIDHALKLEKLFNVQTQTLLEIQLKNDLLQAKNTNQKKYDHYKLEHLLPE